MNPLDLLLVLKNCQADFQLANQLIGKEHHPFTLTPREVDEAIESLTEPFDPAKHLTGWVKDRNFTNRYSHGAFKIIDLGNQSKWAIQDEWGDVYQGPIKTAAFFHALCEALNIK